MLHRQRTSRVGLGLSRGALGVTFGMMFGTSGPSLLSGSESELFGLSMIRSIMIARLELGPIRVSLGLAVASNIATKLFFNVRTFRLVLDTYLVFDLLGSVSASN